MQIEPAMPFWLSGDPGHDQSIVRYLALFSLAALAFAAHFGLGDAMPVLSIVLALASSVTCGLAWLLARSLFRTQSSKEIWPAVIVVILFGMVATLNLATAAGIRHMPVIKLIDSAAVLLSSTVLTLPFIEAMTGLGREIENGERHFRLAFLAGYAALILFGVLLFRSSLLIPSLDDWQMPVQVSLALLAVAGGAVATLYRLRHPVDGSGKQPQTTPSIDADPFLTESLLDLLGREHIYRDHELKVGVLARRLGVPEYKISNAVTRGLGYSNFVRLINTYRIMDAKRRLSCPDQAQFPILTIALDSGFASIGPFNRAFKADSGMTPSAFRESMKC